MTAPTVDLTGVLRPVREGNAFEETVERMLTVIKLGLVGHGERFPAERELAAQLGVSRLTLREAIHELHEAGYVCSRRGRFGGTFVTYDRPAPNSAELARLARQDGDKLTDALTFRLAVESGAAEALALRFAAASGSGSGGGGVVVARRARAARGSGSGLALASGVPDDHSGAGAAGGAGGDTAGADAAAIAAARELLLIRLADVNAAKPHDYRRMDTLFHLCIAELTGSSLLASAAADARMRLNDLLNAIPVLPRNIAHAARQHAAIVESILAGDADRARHEVAEHLAGTAALLRGFLA
ncbi:MAG TPA: GntR family transcriptional regulator [Streptosporangiaceae bacterium]|nr:GntR family transcriptional regulator [Streptosporangiaceae bacterium]